VLAIGVVALYLGLNTASEPFAMHRVMMAAACTGFLIFIARRAGGDH
jgi:hypothetical protein